MEALDLKKENLLLVGINHYIDPKAFIECSKDMNDSYETTEEYSLNKERKTLIMFDDMIANMLSDKKFQEILTE